MDKRMKASFAVVLALAFVLSFAVVSADNGTEVSGDNNAVVIDTSKTYHDGETFELNKDYVLNANVVLTFEEGSILMMDAIQPWSIGGGAGSALVFEEGSIVILDALTYEKENVIDKYTSVAINGKVSYGITVDVTSTPMTATATFTIDNNTSAVVNGITYSFKATELTVKADIDMPAKDLLSEGLSNLAAIDGSIKISVKMESDGINFIFGEIALGSIKDLDLDVDIEATTPASTGTDKYKVSVDGDFAMEAEAMGVTVNITENMDFSAGVQGITDAINWLDPRTLADVIPFIDGDMSGRIAVNGEVDTMRVENAYVNYSANFGNDKVEMDVTGGIDSLSVNYGEVRGEVKDIVAHADVAIGLGSLMEMLSGRNIVGTTEFFMIYEPEMAKPAMSELLKDFVAPLVPVGMDVGMYIDAFVSQIPDEYAYAAGMPYAYALFFAEEIEELDYASVCRQIYASIPDEGIVSKMVDYASGVSEKSFEIVTGIDDYEPMTIDGSCSFSMGEFNAVSDLGYEMTFDGFEVQADLDDGISASCTIGSIQTTADTQEIVAEIVTPEFSSEFSIGEKGIEVKAAVSGDLKFVWQNKANDVKYVDMSYEFKGIDAKADALIGLETVDLSLEESVDGIEIAIGPATISAGKISQVATLSYDAGNIGEIFSMRNLDYIAEFLMTAYDPFDSDEALKEVLMDVFYTAIPEEETEEYIDHAIEALPEEYRPAIGIGCEYVLFVFEKEGMEFQSECQKIKNRIGDLTDAEKMAQYFSEVASETFKVVTGLDEYIPATLTADYSVDIGKIDAAFNGEKTEFLGASLDIKIGDDSITVDADFKGLDVNVNEAGFSAKLQIPSITVALAMDDEVSADLKVKGDFVFKYTDPDDLLSSYTISIEDINIKDSIVFGEDGVITVDAGYEYGEVFAEHNMKQSISNAYLYADGADLKVKGTIDMASVIEAVFENDYSLIKSDLDVKGTIAGVMYDQVVVGKILPFKAAIDEMSIDIKASTGENGPAISGTVEIADAYYGNDNTFVGIESATAKVDFANDNGTVDVLGEVRGIMFINGEARYWIQADDVVLKGNIVPADEIGHGYTIEPTEVSADVALWENGITTDFGKITMTGNFKDMNIQIESEKATISGNYTGSHDIESIEGYISGIKLIPSNDSGIPKIEFSDAEVTFTEPDGASDTITFTIDKTNKIVQMDCVTSGEGIAYSDYDSSMFFMMILGYAYYDYTDRYIISGDVPVVMPYVDFDRDIIEGRTAVINGYVNGGDYYIDVDFVGAMLTIDGGKTGGPIFGIQALPGYELDPSTYVGFSVDSSGNVTPVFDMYGEADLATQSKGLSYTLTIDGFAHTATYGELYTQTFTGGEPLWLVDADGETHGYVVAGVFYYTYDVVGDLSLTTVLGTKADTGAAGSLVKVDADGFYVQPSDETFVVENKAGVRFVIAGSSEDNFQKFSATETKYDGKRAYDINGNTTARIMIPIDSIDAFVYHVVNDTMVPMATSIYYDSIGDHYYATFQANSYSLYVVDEYEHGGGSGGSDLWVYAVIAIAGIIVIAAIIVVYKKNGNSVV